MEDMQVMDLLETGKTVCCNAQATFLETGLICKNCYQTIWIAE